MMLPSRIFGALGSLLLLGAHSPLALPSSTSNSIPSADSEFISLTNLGNNFQIDSGRLAEQNASDPAVRAYATLMVTTHTEVENNLQKMLRQRGLTPTPAPLLQGAYKTICQSLSSEHGKQFDIAYVESQVDYQQANLALYQQELSAGSDPGIKGFATNVIPKVQDHKQRAAKLAATKR